MPAIRDFYLVKKAEIRTANNGSPYLTLTLHNGQKELSAKKWDFSGNPPKTGDVIFIDDATMGEYRGNPQVTINSYRVAAKNDAPIERFVPTTKGDVNLMFLLVQESAKSILNTNLQQLVVSILELHKKKFKQDEFSEQHRGYMERHRIATERVAELEDKQRNRQNKSLTLERFIREIETRPLVIDEFDERLWLAAIDKVIVNGADDIQFNFRDGTSINV